MVEQSSARVQSKTQKSKYVPQVRMVPGRPGVYTVTSERYVYVLYEVNVQAYTCTCEAAQFGRPTCKHRAAGRLVYQMHQAQHAAASRGAQPLLEAFGL